MLSQGGDTTEALAMLRDAEGYAGRQELWPLQGRVRRLLDHLGEAPQQIDSEAMASLTAAERRVAALAAEGLTNRQIAEQLLVSVKAVEWHLSNVYRKLEIRSRKALTPRDRRLRLTARPSLDSAPWPSAPRTPCCRWVAATPTRSTAPPLRWSCSST